MKITKEVYISKYVDVDIDIDEKDLALNPLNAISDYDARAIDTFFNNDTYEFLQKIPLIRLRKTQEENIVNFNLRIQEYLSSKNPSERRNR
jgi:hypothetical protein